MSEDVTGTGTVAWAWGCREYPSARWPLARTSHSLPQVRKHVLGLRRCAVVHHLHVLISLPQTERQAA
jgi:hypothetical protein